MMTAEAPGHFLIEMLVDLGLLGSEKRSLQAERSNLFLGMGFETRIKTSKGGKKHGENKIIQDSISTFGAGSGALADGSGGSATNSER
jgi:hypothetical protein